MKRIPKAGYRILGSASYGNTIEIFSDEKILKQKVMSIVTDSTALDEPKDPDTNTIFALYKLFAAPDEAEQMRQKFLQGGYGYGHAKKELLETIQSYFESARKRRDEIMRDKAYAEQVLHKGAIAAREKGNNDAHA